MSTRNRKAKPAARVRCAIYTRKSTEEGLEQEFNSLDAQRDSGEAYVKSLQHEGWECLPDRYDDGGFTGGNMDRPAVKRLMADIQAGKVDCVVVYKVDRLSRSLLDFAKMMETFEKHRVAFVSVTQQFNTSASMGRLVLNVLLSFAQFEREIISERTRDKIAASRRKGKWSGGMPLLGYDVDPRGSKLVVNDDESAKVRQIFDLYLEHQSIIGTIKILDQRGWLNKRWKTRKGHERGGLPFTKTSLFKLLTNVTYTGKIRYKDEVHEGEHCGIVDLEIWNRVQAILARNGRSGSSNVRNQFGALLKGILRCSSCGCSMTPTHTTKDGGKKRYRYYVCTAAQKRGWHTCPAKSIPAGEIERFIVDQIRCIGRDQRLQHETFAASRMKAEANIAELESEHLGIQRDLARWNIEVRKLLSQISPTDSDGPALKLMADHQERIGNATRRSVEIREEIGTLKGGIVDEKQFATAVSSFDPVWDSLTSHEQARLVHLLIQTVDYNGSTGDIEITFHPSGIASLAEEISHRREKESA